MCSGYVGECVHVCVACVQVCVCVCVCVCVYQLVDMCILLRYSS